MSAKQSKKMTRLETTETPPARAVPEKNPSGAPAGKPPAKAPPGKPPAAVPTRSARYPEAKYESQRVTKVEEYAVLELPWAKIHDGQRQESQCDFDVASVRVATTALRDKLLDEIMKCLLSDVAQKVVLSGASGSGKSHILWRLVVRLRTELHFVVFLHDMDQLLNQPSLAIRAALFGASVLLRDATKANEEQRRGKESVLKALCATFPAVTAAVESVQGTVVNAEPPDFSPLYDVIDNIAVDADSLIKTINRISDALRIALGRNVNVFVIADKGNRPCEASGANRQTIAAFMDQGVFNGMVQTVSDGHELQRLIPEKTFAAVAEEFPHSLAKLLFPALCRMDEATALNVSTHFGGRPKAWSIAAKMLIERHGDVALPLTEAEGRELLRSIHGHVATQAPAAQAPMDGASHTTKVLIPQFGHGGSGTAFVARLQCGRTACVKVVKRDPNKTACNEVEVMKCLRHKNVLQYYGCVEKEGTIEMFMEYAEGGTLSSFLKTLRNRSLPLIRNWTLQILRGVKYLHDCNVVHRDIKGANVLVTVDGVVKLANFGSSKKCKTADACSDSHGCDSWPVGTVRWMAPEVMNCGAVGANASYGTKCDIWSVGCTFVELYTGHVPWEALSNDDTAFYVIASSAGLPPEISDFNDPQLKNFLERCFERDPSKRASAAELLEHPFLKDAALPLL